MPTLSFKKQFCGRVEAGEKTHSLRSKRARAWKVGDYLGLYYALRTKQSRLLGRTTVVRVQEVSLTISRCGALMDICIDGERLSLDEANDFAIRDGFTGVGGMRLFWQENNGMKAGETWIGDLIHWKFPFTEAPCR